MTSYTRMHESAERVAMRRWLRNRGVDPVMGKEPSDTERLMKQVIAQGGDPHQLMAGARGEVDRKGESDDGIA